MLKFFLFYGFGGFLMRKVDLLDELRSEIGVVSDKCADQVNDLYQFVCESLQKKMPGYQWVSIYLVQDYAFVLRHDEGERILPQSIPFGEGLISVAAARGSMVRERLSGRVEVYMPFYRGHHLIGVLVVIAKRANVIDEEDVSLFMELASLFETKVEKYNS
jgi:L-methionine (R)-S-oxide reductase